MPTAISIENVSKSYRLGEYGTGTLANDIKVWWAKARGKANPVLKIDQIEKIKTSGQELWALRDVSFKVNQGDVLGIIGRNGAGKSTLLKILSRVTAPTRGQIRVKGRIASLLEVGTGFHPELTGRENIYLNGAILGMSREEVRRKFDEIVDFSEVEQFIDTPVKRYSSGMYVRLAFAIAAHLDPEILVVDEVLAVGDTEFQKKCLGRMGDVAKEGRTVLFVSHNMAAVENLCKTGLFLDRGKLVHGGDLQTAIAMYSGTSEKNIRKYESGPIQCISVFQDNASIVISVDYKLGFDINLPKLGFVVSDHAGYRLFGSNVVIDEVPIVRKPRRQGSVRVRVNQPKLYNGTYKLSIWFGSDFDDFFIDKDCLEFDILNMASLRQPIRSSSGPVAPLCEWEIID